MPPYPTNSEWSRRRAFETRKHRSGKLKFKAINFIRRVAIVVLRSNFKQFSKTEVQDLDSIKSVLLIPNAPLGDMILMSPLWKALKDRKPDLKIGIVASPRNRELLKGETEIDTIYDFFGGSRVHRWGEVLRARKDPWDIVLTTAGFFKPVRYAVLTRFIAGNALTGTLHASRHERYATLYSYCFKRPETNIVEQFQYLVEACLGMKFRDEERRPHVTVPEATRRAIAERIAVLKLQTGKRRMIQIHLEAKAEDWEWGIENNLNLARKLSGSYPDAWVLFTSTPQFWNAFRPSAISNEGLHYFEVLNVLELAALVSLADLVVTPDTAVAHIAAAFQRPVVGLYMLKYEWMPYRTKSHILIPREHQSVRNISVEDVFAACSMMLDHP